MDNISKSERGGCGNSLTGGLLFFGIIIALALWIVLIEYLIIGVFIILFIGVIISWLKD